NRTSPPATSIPSAVCPEPGAARPWEQAAPWAERSCSPHRLQRLGAFLLLSGCREIPQRGPPRLYTARFRPELIHFRPATGLLPQRHLVVRRGCARGRETYPLARSALGRRRPGQSVGAVSR